MKYVKYMKHIRRLATRGLLVPLALFALVIASSLPASAQTQTVDDVITPVGTYSMNW